MSIRICDTKCCGVKELDGLDDHPSPDEAMRHLCYSMTGGQYTQRFQFEPDPAVENGQIRKTIWTPPKLRPNYSLFTFTGVVTRRQADHSSSRLDNYGQAFADLIANHSLGPVSTGRAVRSRRTTNDIQLWCWEFDLDRLQSWWLERCPRPAEVADVKVPPAGKLPDCDSNYTFNIGYVSYASPGSVIRVPNGVQQTEGAYRRAMEEEVRRFREEMRQAAREEARLMDPTAR